MTTLVVSDVIEGNTISNPVQTAGALWYVQSDLVLTENVDPLV